MHFALPPRKTSQPPPYAKAAAARTSSDRRRKLYQLGSYLVLGILTIYLVYHYAFSSHSSDDDGIVDNPDGTPSIVILTVLDEESMSPTYIQKIKANRDDYAARHGYTTFYTNVSTYSHLISPAPTSWSLVRALRHALTLHPSTRHIFSLSPHALITNSSLSLYSHILSPTILPTLLIPNHPVVPPDSVIHTFSHLTPSKTDLILTQDRTNLAHHSLLLRNSDWARFFLDTWFDPLYRGYNFQKAEGHALEHIVQWHPTVLAKLVLVPQRRMNSYNVKITGADEGRLPGDAEEVDGLWQEGDFLVRFAGCEVSAERSCEEEMQPYWERWERQVEKLDGKGVDRG